jgi:hypothetical protein
VSGAAQQPAWVAAAELSTGQLARPPLEQASQARQKLALALAVAKKCLDLGLPRPPVPSQQQGQQQDAASPQGVEPPQEQQRAYMQLAQATSQLQKQSTALVSALESQSTQLAQQQRLLQELATGMLFVAAKSAARPAVPLTAAPAQPEPTAGIPGMGPTGQQPAKQCGAQQALKGHSGALLHDLASLLAAQRQQQQTGAIAGAAAAPLAPASQQLCSSLAGPRLLPRRIQATCQPTGTPAGLPTDIVGLHMGGRQATASGRGLAVPAAPWQAGQAGAMDGSSTPRGPRREAKPEWDDRITARQPLGAARRRPRLDDPVEPRRRPAGATASLAAQLLMQELSKYQPRPKPQQAPRRQQAPAPVPSPGQALAAAPVLPRAPVIPAARPLSLSRPSRPSLMQPGVGHKKAATLRAVEERPRVAVQSASAAEPRQQESASREDPAQLESASREDPAQHEAASHGGPQGSGAGAGTAGVAQALASDQCCCCTGQQGPAAPGNTVESRHECVDAAARAPSAGPIRRADEQQPMPLRNQAGRDAGAREEPAAAELWEDPLLVLPMVS